MNLERPRHVLAALLLCALPAAAQAPLTLFNGTSLLGWNTHGTWTVTPPSLVANGGGPRNIVTAVPFADLNLQFDYNESAPIAARFRLWTTPENSGGLTVNLDPIGSSYGVGGIESLSKSSISSISSGWHHVQVEASHGSLSVRIDGQPAGSAANLGARGGYLAFEASGSGSLELRNLRLAPLNLANVFNGNDLSGWKSIARGPASKGGVGHTVAKTLTLGLGGGDTKPHEAKWSVRAGAIHGENGPGGLENATQLQDGILQIAATVKGSVKPDNFPALSARTAPGQMDGGYGLGIGAFAGNIDRVVKHPAASASTFVDQTIVLAGRTTAIWVGGTLTTLHTDTRADNSSGALGAKTGPGALTLLLPEGGQQIDVQRLTLAALSRTYGMVAKAPAPSAPAALPVSSPPGTPAAPPASPAETALLQQQQANAQKDAEDRTSKQRTASLMSHALATTDPQQQMADYGQVVQLDPSNAAAVQGFKEAQARVQAQQAAQQNAATAEVSQQHDAETREAQTKDSLVKAQGSFLAGNLGEASMALAVAERLSPGNPIARDLRTRINSAQSLRSRLFMLGGGAGILGLAGLLAVWLRRRKQQRYPALEMTRGLDTGRIYPLDKDIIRIGAVPQDGGQRNDIVIQDVVHAISRFHCEIARKNGQLYVSDLKSSNGTRLNNEPLQPGRPELLRRGDRITLANDVELRFGHSRRDSTKS